MRVTKVIRLSLDRSFADREYAHLDGLPPEERRIYENVKDSIESMVEQLGIRGWPL